MARREREQFARELRALAIQRHKNQRACSTSVEWRVADFLEREQEAIDRFFEPPRAEEDE